MLLLCLYHAMTDVNVDNVDVNLKISKLDLCEGGSFSTAIFNSDIQLSFFLLLFVFYICLSVCRFVKGNVFRNSHIVLFSRY